MIRRLPQLLALASCLATTHSFAEDARFVRIELPGENRILTLAEVEVISGGKNIAPKGKASQSSTSNNGVAGKATDGNKNPSFTAGGQTHTIEGGRNGNEPWWELDFGKAGPIEAVEIWNRGEGALGDRLNGFT